MSASTSPLAFPPSHPWYYALGHSVVPPRAILSEVRREGYRGYRSEEIEQISRRSEPERTRQLERLRTATISELRCDLARYRQCACAYRRYRMTEAGPETVCAAVHTALSLKYCHLANGFAHLAMIDELPRQQDLFG